MAIYVNGIKVAGRGISGKSPYQIAVGEGYTGTEAEFNAQLAAIGEAVAGFDELKTQVESAKTNVEQAVTQANQAVSDALADIDEAKQEINTAISDAEAQIDEKVAEALASIPDSENLVTKTYLTNQNYATVNQVNNAVRGYATETYVQTEITKATAAIVTDIWYYGSTAPENKKLLWIDSNSTTGGLKFYKSASDGWVHVPVAWQ